MCLSPLCCPGRFIGQACFTCPSLRSGVESAHLTTTTDKREGVIHLEEGRQNLQMTTMESVLKRPAGLTSSTCSTYRRGNWVAGMLSPESSEELCCLLLPKTLSKSGCQSTPGWPSNKSAAKQGMALYLALFSYPHSSWHGLSILQVA